MGKIGLLLLFIIVVSSITWSIDAPSKPAKETLPATKINPKDGAEMVLVPAGEFLMGSKDDDKLADDNEKPQHKVNLDSYYIYKTEVTVAQFRKFCHATGRKSMPPKPKWGWIDNHPIVNVNWNDAKAYADWAGVKLPSEAQWEKAARGTDCRIYPWGNEWDGEKCVNCTNSDGGTKPVGSVLAGISPYGCFDMAGNVFEWCADWYSSNYYNNTPIKNPMGPKTGEFYVLRGGSWNSYGADGKGCYRCAFRDYVDPYSIYYNYIGFRCASPVP
jgi:formylglycine-generating enzyme required for sulfatase activity